MEYAGTEVIANAERCASARSSPNDGRVAVQVVRREGMEPRIVEKDQIILVGFSFFGDPFATSAGWTEENEIGRIWQRLMAYLEIHGRHIKHVKDAEIHYEVHIEHEETESRGHYEVFAGMEVEKLEDVPVQLLVKVLPATKYAVFTFKGEQITSDWSKMIFHEWMPQSGYQRAHRYGFQLYDHRFRGLDNIDQSELDVYVPIEQRRTEPARVP
jgi:AraC family transcriptional regulator